MRSNYNIKDAQGDLKELNDHLLEVGQALGDRQIDTRVLENLLQDEEFSRLMANMKFIQQAGYAYLAEIYESRAQHYWGLAK